MSVAIMMSAGSTGIDEPPGITALSLWPGRPPPRTLEQLREGRAEPYLVVAGAVDVAGDREELGAAVVRLAEREKGVRPVAQNPGHRGEGLGVVDGGRPAIG